MKPKRKILEETFNGQLFNLRAYGCPPEILSSLLELQNQVLGCCELLTGKATDYLFPFLPVLPHTSPRFFKINKDMFFKKYGYKLIINAFYEEQNDTDNPYYLIGIREWPSHLAHNHPGEKINGSQLTALVLHSIPLKPLYAHGGRYKVGKNDGENELGIWINPANGSSGPFDKNKYGLLVTKYELIAH